MKNRLWSLTAIGLLAMVGDVIAQGGPLGDEFRVNTYTTGTQGFRDVAGIVSGEFVATWESANQDGDQYGIYAQRLAMNGSPLGGEFRVNTHTTSNQFYPQLAADTDGQFVVVWQSENQDGDGHGIYAQRYAAWGPAYGGEFQVNTYTTSGQAFPDVAISPGGFVVVWASAGQDGSDDGIFGQRYDGTGVPQGAEFRVNTYTTGPQRFPAVATDSSGNFVVIWEGYSSTDELLGIFGQRYSGAGVPLGGEFRVNSYTSGNQRSPAVDRQNQGGSLFTIVWRSDGQDGSGEGVFGQRYDAGGVPMGSEFRVNTFTTGDQSSPAVNVTTIQGRGIVTWQSDLQDGSASGIFTRVYFNGFPAGPEFRINTYTSGAQTGPAVAFSTFPHWMFAWTSAQDADGSAGVYAQLWTDLPVELQSFVVE